jgi:F0F1-type ATP synthase assembly protein I
VLRDERGKAQDRFVSNYYLSRIIKIFSCLIFLVAYMLLNKPDALRFAVAFLVVYFLYSVFEVVVLKKEMSDMDKPAAEESDPKTE